MQTIGACLCFKDSARYLHEWLLFHYVQGIRRFYLYNNESSDGWFQVVRPWLQRGLATVTDFPGKGVQAEIYDHCLAKAKGEVEWLAFIDDDEFLFPTGNESLNDVLSDYSSAAGLAVAWVLFGSGGLEKQSDDWVINRFVRSGGVADSHAKCIVRPDRVIRSLVIGHLFESAAGFQIVDENGRPVTKALNGEPSASRIRINHYLIKSWEEWRFRRQRPQANTGVATPLPEERWRAWDRDWSRVPDLSALKYLSEMQQNDRFGLD